MDLTQLKAEVLLHPGQLTELTGGHAPALTEGLKCPTEGRIHFVDINLGRVFTRTSPAGQWHCNHVKGETLGFLGMVDKRPNLVILGLKTGIGLLDLETNRIWRGPGVRQAGNFRLNDGDVTPAGNAVVAGTLDLGFTEWNSGFYSIGAKDAEWKQVFSDAGIGNGVAFMPSNFWMVWIDSFKPFATIHSYDLSTGEIGQGKNFVKILDGTRFPNALGDGITIDKDGNLFVCEWGKSRISVWSCTGKFLGHISVPFLRPTSIAFGGPSFQSMFITSERLPDDLGDEHELAGGVVVIEQTLFTGRPANAWTAGLELFGYSE